MADRPTVTQADRSEIQNRIDQSLNYILNGPGAFWPEGGSRSLQEIVSNLTKYRASLPSVQDVNDPDDVYRSTLNDLDAKMYGFGEKLKAASQFPDDLDVIPPFRDEHIEVKPPSPFFPKPSPKDLLNQFNNPISFQPNTAAAPDATASPPLQSGATQNGADNGPTRFLVRRTYDPSQASPFAVQPTSSPPSSDGSLSLNDAYLEYLKRLNAN
jgi:hypothetical protein